MSLGNLTHREEYLRKKRIQKRIKLGIFVFIVVLSVAVASYVSNRAEFRITDIVLEGGVLVTEEEVKNQSREYLEGSYFWLFPKDNAFLYPSKDLKNHLKDRFKRIDTIDSSLKGLNVLVIKITERKPFAIWCNTIPGIDNSLEEGLSEEVIQDEDCYFIDQNSTIFAKAPVFSGNAYFKFYGIISGDSPLGKEYMNSSSEFAGISDFIRRVKEMSIKPLYIVGKENDQFSLVLSGGGQIYFDTEESMSKVGDNLEALLKTPELKLDSKGNLPVEYIDLRYGNKLFYKLK